MQTVDNRFIRRQFDAMLDAERRIVRLYAESCFLTIQIVLGDVLEMDRLEQLADDLVEAELKLQLLQRALNRLGVPSAEMARLSEHERLDLFEAHFKDADASMSSYPALFERSDLRQMLDDISVPSPAGLPT